MKTLNLLVHGSLVLGVALSSIAVLGCADHERVVVHDRPEVVRERVIVAAPPPPVVREQVIIRP